MGKIADREVLRIKLKILTIMVRMLKFVMPIAPSSIYIFSDTILRRRCTEESQQKPLLMEVNQKFWLLTSTEDADEKLLVASGQSTDTSQVYFTPKCFVLTDVYAKHNGTGMC